MVTWEVTPLSSRSEEEEMVPPKWLLGGRGWEDTTLSSRAGEEEMVPPPKWLLGVRGWEDIPLSSRAGREVRGGAERHCHSWY